MPGKTVNLDQKYINAVNAHARAILELADAIRESSLALLEGGYEQAAPSSRALARIALSAKLSPLTHGEVLREIGKCFDQDKTPEDSTPLNHFVDGGPAGAVTMLEAIEDWPPFKSRGLNLSPNDLRHLKNCGELAQIISWGLRNAAKGKG